MQQQIRRAVEKQQQQAKHMPLAAVRPTVGQGPAKEKSAKLAPWL